MTDPTVVSFYCIIMPNLGFKCICKKALVLSISHHHMQSFFTVYRITQNQLCKCIVVFNLARAETNASDLQHQESEVKSHYSKFNEVLVVPDQSGY